MKICAFDFETFLIGYPDQVAPTPVCMSWSEVEFDISESLLKSYGNYICPTQDIEKEVAAILTKAQTGEYDALICANAAFELSEIAVHYPKLRPVICELLKTGKVWDVQIMEKLINISTSGNPDATRNSLVELEKRYLGKDRSHLKKGDDIWRLRYSELYNVPIKDWPQEAIDYSIDDSIGTARVFIEMMKIIQPSGVGSANTAPLQTAFDFYMKMATINGFDIDQDSVAELEAKVEELITPSRTYLLEAEYMAPKKDGKRGKRKKKLQEYIVATFGEDTPRTAKGQISTKADDLKNFPADPLIDKWIEYMTYEKLLTTYIPQMKFSRIHPNMNCIVKTGRCSGRSSNYHKDGKFYPSVNIQNLPRAFDVRPCYKAREGNVLIAIDYAQLELCSVAQFAFETFGLSDLREKINAGVDLHSDLACVTMNMDYEEFMKRRKAGDAEVLEARQMHKPITLGVFGGQGHRRIQEEINGYLPKEKHITVEDAQALKQIAIGRYREATLFFGSGRGHSRIQGHLDSLKNGRKKYNKDKKRSEELYAFEVSGRYHNNRTYCAVANGITMQSRSADGAKAATCKVGEACLLEGTPLSGCEIKAFVHDELIIEVPADGHILAVIEYMANLMIDAMHKFMPDVRITVEASVMKRWLKSGPFIMERKIYKEPVR